MNRRNFLRGLLAVPAAMAASKVVAIEPRIDPPVPEEKTATEIANRHPDNPCSEINLKESSVTNFAELTPDQKKLWSEAIWRQQSFFKGLQWDQTHF